MASNFDFIKDGWATLYESAAEAEQNALTAPRTCAFYARRALEGAVRWLYANDGYLKIPYQDNLAALIHEQTFRDNLAPGLFNWIRFIHKLGNLAVHSNSKIGQSEGLQATKGIFAVLGWLARIYSSTPPEIPEFDETLIPKPIDVAVADKNAQQLQELQETLAQKDAVLAERGQRIAETEEQITALKQQIAEIKAQNKQAVPEIDYTEEETRDLFIDLMLREAGWNPDAADVREYEVEGMPNETGLGYVDYVLWGKDKLPLAVVEAKRTKVDPQQGERQAELYADCLEKMKGQRPIIFYTNGYETWLWDDTNYPPRSVQGFYTRDELQLLINRRTTQTDIRTAEINRDIVDRYYHEEAIRRVTEAYTDRARKALLVMATGTGKTRLSIALVDILTKCNWAKRVLFLADRTALVNQAKNAFNQCLPNASLVNITKEKEDDDSRIVFSTHPTMMNCIDETRTGGVKRFGVGHFDLIIIDEAHRSVYLKYRAIFEYFDAMLLGLTATPKEDVDRNTYQLFEMETHVPTYAYELDQAVEDKYLVPPTPVSVPLKFQRVGIKYDDLSEEEKDEYELTFRDEETGEIPDKIEPAALNQWLFNADTVDKVLAYLMERGLKVEGGDKLGKTIIFAKNHNHAEFIRERFDANYPHLAGKFLRVIDHQIKYAQSLIDDFYGGSKDPFVAVSVDMLDTGIDVHEIVNLVFFKIVRSKAKFWQMLGRGTRLCENLFGPGQDKEFFYIFDFCQNLEYFGQNPDGIHAPVQESVKQKIFKRRLALVQHFQGGELAQDESLQQLRSDVLDIMHQGVNSMNVDNFLVRPHRRHLETFGQRERWDHLTAGDVSDIVEHLTPLPTPDEDDEFARRFDLLVLNLQLSVLESLPQQEVYVDRVRDLAAGLEEKQSIPSVGQHLELILEIQTDEYWCDVTLPMLEDVRRKLRDLVKFLDREGSREKVYTDFEDQFGEEIEIAGLVKTEINLRNYRLKVERFVREHQTHITVHKLQHNQPITSVDIQALEDILFSGDELGTKEDFVKAFGTEQPLGCFVRRVVGLDRNSAKEAFAEFLSKGTLTADQITFINQIVDHLAQNGLMAPEALFEPPFTDLHDQGIQGVFPDAAASIIKVIEIVNDNAMVA